MRARPTAPRRRSASAATKREGEDEEAIKRLFTPEFRNRLDAIDRRSRRCRAKIDQPGRREVRPPARSAARRPQRHRSSCHRSARDWLAENGYDELYGARPLARVIQEHIKKPLADELLFGKLEGGGTVRVMVEEKDGKKALAFAVIETKPLVKIEETDGSNDGEGGDRTPTALIPKVPLNR